MKRILTKCKNFYCLMLFIFLSAFTARPYSQLMIGGWKSIDSNEIFLEQENIEKFKDLLLVSMNSQLDLL